MALDRSGSPSPTVGFAGVRCGLDLQAATEDLFIRTIEDIVGRKVRAFASAIDPGAGVVFEVFAFHSQADTRSDGHRPIT